MWWTLGSLELSENWANITPTNATTFRFTGLNLASVPFSARGWGYLRFLYLGLPDNSYSPIRRLYANPDAVVIEVPRAAELEAAGYITRIPQVRRGRSRYLRDQFPWSVRIEVWQP